MMTHPERLMVTSFNLGCAVKRNNPQAHRAVALQATQFRQQLSAWPRLSGDIKKSMAPICRMVKKLKAAICHR
jgi:hypothetical protein